MPHRNMKSISELYNSVNKLHESAKDSHVIIAGDFNCRNINWNNMTVDKDAPERDVQQALIDLAVELGLTQVHEQPTRDTNLLDLLLTSNPSLVTNIFY